MPKERSKWWSRELFRGPATWKVMVVCAFGTVFLAGIHYGNGRRRDAAMWLLLAAFQLGVAYYQSRNGRKPRR